MIDVTGKSSTLRVATAQAILKVSKPETLQAVRDRTVPKGDVLEVSRTAGLFAVKRTADMIPDCHPMPVESTRIWFDLTETEITIHCEVKTIYKTGVEVEAMHGASVIALTIYDMLKPIDKGIEISTIKLLKKQGGKSDTAPTQNYRIAAIVCSDTVSVGSKEDRSGKVIVERLGAEQCVVVPDEADLIREQVQSFIQQGYDLVLTTGGTGVSKRDCAPEAVRPLIDREIPGIMETFRHYGQQRNPFAMLSRGIAGFSGDTLIITLPGSPRAVNEAIDVLFPHVWHCMPIKEGASH